MISQSLVWFLLTMLKTWLFISGVILMITVFWWFVQYHGEHIQVWLFQIILKQIKFFQVGWMWFQSFSQCCHTFMCNFTLGQPEEIRVDFCYCFIWFQRFWICDCTKVMIVLILALSKSTVHCYWGEKSHFVITSLGLVIIQSLTSNLFNN